MWSQIPIMGFCQNSSIPIYFPTCLIDVKPRGSNTPGAPSNRHLPGHCIQTRRGDLVRVIPVNPGNRHPSCFSRHNRNTWQLSRALNTGLWLVQSDHLTWIQAYDWSRVIPVNSPAYIFIILAPAESAEHPGSLPEQRSGSDWSRVITGSRPLIGHQIPVKIPA